jgi:hypothetical protein
MAENEQETKQEVAVVITIDENHVLVPSIAFVFDKVRKHNQGKFSNLARFSRESFCEYLLEQGIRTVDNAVDADMKRRDEAAYVEAMAKLQQPTPNEKDPQKYADALGAYLLQVDALKKKFHIGGTQQQV